MLKAVHVMKMNALSRFEGQTYRISREVERPSIGEPGEPSMFEIFERLVFSAANADIWWACVERSGRIDYAGDEVLDHRDVPKSYSETITRCTQRAFPDKWQHAERTGDGVDPALIIS